MDMSDERDTPPLDARLLGETLIQLNISRRNVSIYPRGHPAVERSLNRAFDSLRKLLSMKPEIVLAVARDTLIFDDFAMESRNSAYREFALTLSRMNIVSVAFLQGITKDELYEFHLLLCGNVKDTSGYASLQEALPKFSNIQIVLVDYGAFSFSEGKEEGPVQEEHLWERYVYGLLDGTLQTEEASGEEVSGVVEEVPSENLSAFLNNAITDSIAEGACDRLVNTFMMKTTKRTFSFKGIKKLIELINGLKPELKKEFLSRAVNTLAGDIAATEKTLNELSGDKAKELFKVINEYDIAIPEQLEKLFDKFTKLHQEGIEDRFFNGSLIMDDIVLSHEISDPLKAEKPGVAAGDEVYHEQMRQLLLGEAPAVATEGLRELKRECSEEHIGKDFNETVLEFLLPESSEDDYGYFVALLKEQVDQFLWTGQYGEVLRIVKVLEANILENRFVEKTAESLRYYRSGEFISKVVDSLRVVGRQMRQEALLLCEYYGEGILPDLFKTLIEEESPTVRRFFLGLIAYFGERAIPEALKRLDDSRWFVTRNMLFIISECGGRGAGERIRPYCNHENPKVGFEAIKCLLKAGDSYGITAIREHLKSEDRERREQAITLSGSFRIHEVVPDLVSLLKKREVSSADFHAKIPVVRALGQMGDPGALETLGEILLAKSFLFKGAVEKLREEIYATLKNYPIEKLTGIIESGLKSKNEQIRKAALQLRSRR
jgi:hypothetical protein